MRPEGDHGSTSSAESDAPDGRIRSELDSRIGENPILPGGIRSDAAATVLGPCSGTALRDNETELGDGRDSAAEGKDQDARLGKFLCAKAQDKGEAGLKFENEPGQARR